MGILSTISAVPARLGTQLNNNNRITRELLEFVKLPVNTVFEQLNTNPDGFSEDEVDERLKRYGENTIVHEKKLTFFGRLWENIRNPLVILLVLLGVISYLTGDQRATLVIGSMVLLGIILRFVQESRADHAAEQLKAMVNTTSTVLREGEKVEIPLSEVVPGDLVYLSAGDMIPADLRILSAKDLFLNQAVMTGEAIPVEKFPLPAYSDASKNLFDIPNLCIQGCNVESGTAMAVVLATGKGTYFGALASTLTTEQPQTNFDKGINQFTWLMIGFMLVMVPLVFVFNGLSKGNWIEAFMFAMAIAVGLTPEMLPMIVTVNLSKGAIMMSKRKVIVKRLKAIQNFGAMDILCTDKTGTITEGQIVLERYIDVSGNANDEILYYAYLNSYFQTGLKNLMDVAILDHKDLTERLRGGDHYRKVDEIPFDFRRKRMSVVLENKTGERVLVTKGAVEEIFNICSQVEVHGKVLPRLPEYDLKRKALVEKLNAQGFRVLAVAYKTLTPTGSNIYSVGDETKMVLKGFLAFLDPPKESAAKAIEKLDQYQVQVKILTGDNELVTRNICRQVGLPVENILLGPQIDELSEAALSELAEKTTLFAKLSPAHKQRIINALQRNDHVVGFMGDGINDAPALKIADVGISVNTAVDIAKESSDIILLENSLLVLEEGILEGRKVFGNIIKYIKMAASSNFGNMFSVLGASLFLPFVPLLPLQVLTNNLLYDFAQSTIPSDDVDREWLAKPRKWAIGELRRFILFFGPISSIFDYATFFLLLYGFNAWHNPTLFHTGWFVESLFTQIMIVHVIRTNKLPFIQSRPSKPLLISSLVIMAVGMILPYSPLQHALGLTPLPLQYWFMLAGIMIAYILLTQAVKGWFYRRYEY